MSADQLTAVAGSIEPAGLSYEQVMQQASMIAQMLEVLCDDMDKALRTIQRTHSVAPLLDPTAYHRGMGNLDDAAALVGPLHTAALKLKPVLKELRERAAKRAVML